MEQHIRCTIDSPLLQRVSKVRQHMGLEGLPTEIPVSELDPLLLYALRREDDADSALDPVFMSQGPEQHWLLFDKKWEQWDDWSRWNRNGS